MFEPCGCQIIEGLFLEISEILRARDCDGLRLNVGPYDDEARLYMSRTTESCVHFSSFPAALLIAFLLCCESGLRATFT